MKIDGMLIQSSPPLGGGVSPDNKGEGKPWIRADGCTKNKCDDSRAMQPEATRTKGKMSKKPDRSKGGEERQAGAALCFVSGPAGGRAQGPSPTVDWLTTFQAKRGRGAQIKGSRDGISMEKPRLGQPRFESMTRDER